MTIQSKPTRRFSTRQMAAGLLVVAGFAVAAASPALADRKHNHGNNHGYYDNGKHRGHYKHRNEVVYYGSPRVIYVEQEPIYVRQRVYVEPEPIYYQPAPRVIYQRPSVNIIVPLFD